MNIEVKLPDGSLASFPQGTPPETMQAEIERYLAQAQSQPVQRQPQTMAQAQPQAATQPPAQPQAPAAGQPPVESLIQEANPVRRRPGMSIEEARALTAQREAEAQAQSAANPRPPKDPATMTDAELRAAEIAAQNPLGNAGRAVADTWRGVTRGIASATQDAAGTVASAVGMPGVGAKLMQGADNIDASLEQRRAIEAEERAAADAEAQRYAQEAARRNPQQQGATGAPQADPNSPPPGPRAEAVGQPVRDPNLRLPGMSISQARTGGAAPNPQFNMADGSTFTARPIPKKALNNAARDGFEFMRQNGDRIVLGMLQNGDITGAKQMREFLRSEKAEIGIKAMGGSIAAMEYGDSDAFGSQLAKMSSNLAPDGPWEVLADKTRLTFDEGSGTVMGAVLGMRNKETGEIIEQEYQGKQEVAAMIADFGAPTSVIDRVNQQINEAVQARVQSAKDYETAFRETFELMFNEDSFRDINGQPIDDATYQQMLQRVDEAVTAARPDLVGQGSAGRQQTPASGVGAGSFTGGSNNQPVPTLQW